MNTTKYTTYNELPRFIRATKMEAIKILVLLQKEFGQAEMCKNYVLGYVIASLNMGWEEFDELRVREGIN
jgi:hypothetical protein